MRGCLLLTTLLLAGTSWADGKLTTRVSDVAAFEAGWRAEPRARLMAPVSASELPREQAILLVLPPAAEPGLSYESLESRALGPAPAELLDAPDAWLPPVRLEQQALVRGTRLQRLVLRPWSLRPSDGQLVLHRQLSFRVDYGETRALRAPTRGGSARERVAEPGRRRQLPSALPGWHADAFSSAIAGVAANADVAIAAGWIGASRAGLVEPAEPWTPGPGALRIEVAADGIYRIDRVTLTAAGWDPDARDPERLGLYLDGREQAIEIQQADGSLEAVVFVGERNRGRYTDTRVYWLVEKPDQPGLRMGRVAVGEQQASSWPAKAVVTASLRLEEQNRMWVKMPHGEQGRDPWFSAALLGRQGWLADCELYPDLCVRLPSDPSGFELPELAPPVPGEVYRVRGRAVSQITGFTTDSQQLLLKLDGSTFGITNWSASADPEHVFELNWNPSRLSPTGNRVEVMVSPPGSQEPAGSWRVVYVDYLELDYPAFLVAKDDRLSFGDASSSAVYHIAGFSHRDLVAYAIGPSSDRVELRTTSLGPGLPLSVLLAYQGHQQGARFHVFARDAYLTPQALSLHTPSAIVDPSTQADYVVLTHSRLRAEAEQLADYRASAAGGGHAPARVFDLQEVFDLFAYGQLEPDAIRDFVAWSYSRWSQAPSVITLVGDTSDDFRNHRGLQDANYDPPSLLPSKEIYLTGIQDLRAISDVWFAAVDGEDVLPDVLIGRIAVRQPQQLASYVAKLQAWDGRAPGSGGRRVQLMADDDIPNDRSECGVAGLAGDTFERLIAAYLPQADPGNLLRRYGGLYDGADPPRQWSNDVVADVNQGLGALLYLGHGNVVSIGRHCDDGNFAALDLDSVERFQPDTVVPVMVAATCDAAQFDFVADFGEVVTESIGERYLNAPDRGVLSVIGTTTALLYAEGESLSEGVFAALFGSERDPVLGDPRVVGGVTLAALIDHWRRLGPGATDGLLTTAVLGDPASRLGLEQP